MNALYIYHGCFPKMLMERIGSLEQVKNALHL